MWDWRKRSHDTKQKPSITIEWAVAEIATGSFSVEPLIEARPKSVPAVKSLTVAVASSVAEKGNAMVAPAEQATLVVAPSTMVKIGFVREDKPLGRRHGG
jgi:hypothetical protein